MTQAPARGSQLPAAQRRFRELLGKVGSGEHTSSGLSLAEAEEAMDAMLLGGVSDAQLGAFLIAHRIRRPEPQELAPLLPLVTLGLLAADECVVLSGGDPMPVKYGITLAELWEALGLALARLDLGAMQALLTAEGLALCHQPRHFPAAERLLPVRDAIGKRPPVASLELLWTPHQGEHLLISGFVHPPTEARAWAALDLADEHDVITVKGLEGSTDLPLARAAIVGRRRRGQSERLILHPRDHGLPTQDPPWDGLDAWTTSALAALGGEGPLAPALRWNLGVQLWLCGQAADAAAGLQRADGLITGGALLQRLGQLRRVCHG